MRYALATLAFFAGIGVAQAAEPYEGAWAASASACRDPDDSNLRITGGRYFEHEGNCKITRKARSGGTFKLTLGCEGEGEKWTKKVELAPSGGTMSIDGAKGRKVVRCENDQRPPNWPRG